MRTPTFQDIVNLALFAAFGLVLFTTYYSVAASRITTAEDINDYYAGVIHFVNPRANKEQIELSAKHRSAFKDFFMLKVGQTQSIGDVDVIFRGIEKGNRFKLDVAILALDPDSFYSHAYRISEAKNGFMLGERKAKLLSAGKRTLHLMLVAENG